MNTTTTPDPVAVAETAREVVRSMADNMTTMAQEFRTRAMDQIQQAVFDHVPPPDGDDDDAEQIQWDFADAVLNQVVDAFIPVVVKALRAARIV